MSSEGPITVLAHWKVGAENIEEVLALVVTLRQQTLQESGCLRFEAYRSVDRPEEILLHEGYADAAAIDAHRASDHYQQLVVRKIIPLLGERKVELLMTRPPA